MTSKNGLFYKESKSKKKDLFGRGGGGKGARVSEKIGGGRGGGWAGIGDWLAVGGGSWTK